MSQPATHVPDAIPSMGSRQLNMGLVQIKIQELELKAATQGGISDANQAMLDFWRLVRHFEGKDQTIVIVPHGVLRKPGEVAQAKIREVTSTVAAELLAFAKKRGQEVRLATEAERNAYRARNARQREQQIQTLANERAEAMRRQMAAVMGTSMPAAPLELPPVEPELALSIGPAAVREIDKILAESVAPEPKPFEVPESKGLSAIPEELAKIGTERQVGLLFAAGYIDLESVSAAKPEDLTKIKGIGPAAAASLITTAAEMLSERARAE